MVKSLNGMTMSDGDNRSMSTPLVTNIDEFTPLEGGNNDILPIARSVQMNNHNKVPMNAGHHTNESQSTNLLESTMAMAHCVEPPIEYQSDSPSNRYDNSSAYRSLQQQSPPKPPAPATRSSSVDTDLYNDLSPDSSPGASDDEQSDPDISFCITSAVSIPDYTTKDSPTNTVNGNNTLNNCTATEAKAMDIVEDIISIKKMPGNNTNGIYDSRQVNGQRETLQITRITDDKTNVKERQVGGNAQENSTSTWQKSKTGEIPNGNDHQNNMDMAIKIDPTPNNNQAESKMIVEESIYSSMHNPTSSDHTRPSSEQYSVKSEPISIIAEQQCKLANPYLTALCKGIPVPAERSSSSSGRKTQRSEDADNYADQVLIGQHISNLLSDNHSSTRKVTTITTENVDKKECSRRRVKPKLDHSESAPTLIKSTAMINDIAKHTDEYLSHSRLSDAEIARELREYRERNLQNFQKHHAESATTNANLSRIPEALASLTGSLQSTPYRIPVLPSTTISFVNTENSTPLKTFPTAVGPSTTLSYIDSMNKTASKTHQKISDVPLTTISYIDPSSTATQRVPNERLETYLNREGGFFQIGPASSKDEEFCFAVIIEYAKDLSQVIPSDLLLSVSDGVCFCYSLLGCAVYTDPIQDLDHPEFLAERAAAIVRCTTENMAKYFHQNPILDIHLVVGSLCLANSKVDLQKLSKITSMNSVSDEVVHELFPVYESGGRFRVNTGSSVVAVSFELYRTSGNKPITTNHFGISETALYRPQLLTNLDGSDCMQIDPTVMDDVVKDPMLITIPPDTEEDVFTKNVVPTCLTQIKCTHKTTDESDDINISLADESGDQDACFECVKGQIIADEEVELKIRAENEKISQKLKEKNRRRMSDGGGGARRKCDEQRRKIMEGARNKLNESGKVRWEEDEATELTADYYLTKYDDEEGRELFEDIGKRKKHLFQAASLEVDQWKEEQQILFWKQRDAFLQEYRVRSISIEQEMKSRLDDQLQSRLSDALKDQAIREKNLIMEEQRIRGMVEEHHRRRLRHIQEEEDIKKLEEGKKIKLEAQAEAAESLEEQLNEFKNEVEKLKCDLVKCKSDLTKCTNEREIKEKELVKLRDRKEYYKNMWIQGLTEYNMMQSKSKLDLYRGDYGRVSPDLYRHSHHHHHHHRSQSAGSKRIHTPDRDEEPIQQIDM